MKRKHTTNDLEAGKRYEKTLLDEEIERLKEYTMRIFDGDQEMFDAYFPKFENIYKSGYHFGASRAIEQLEYIRKNFNGRA